MSGGGRRPWRRAASLAVLPAVLMLAVASVPPALAQDTRLAAGAVASDEPRSPEADELARRLAALVDELVALAPTHGLAAATVERALTGLALDPEVIALERRQPEFELAPWQYLDRVIDEPRVARGRELLATERELLDRLEARYGVDRHVLLAIWGLESDFGRKQGRHSVVRSLATLTVASPRRAAFWRAELVAALRMIDRGEARADDLRGSWAGAMGHVQLMPSTFAAIAVDFDGDGRRDVWASSADALASTAAYLVAAGWTRDLGWGGEAVVAGGVELAPALDAERELTEWVRQSVVPVEPAPRLARAPLRLLMPAGIEGPKFLVSGNFKSITRYNNSTSYALAIGVLADRIAGGVGVAGRWPLEDPPLGRAVAEDLQRRLAVLGIDAGEPDGVIGPRTRSAVREFQRRNGLPADGYAGRALYDRVRQAGAP